MEAMRSATASAWERSSLPLRKARCVYSPGCAVRAPCCKIGYILGQHDQNSRELEDLKDTYLNVFTDDKVVYLHQESLMIDGKKLYFENFTRNMEVNPLQESDIYISHVTLGRQA